MAQILSLLKLIFGKWNFLRMSKFRWRFLKRLFLMFFFFFFLWRNTASWNVLTYLYLKATNNKEFTGNSSLTLFCAESSEKNCLDWYTIFHELKSVLKLSLRIIRKFLKGNYSQTRSRFHSWIDYLKIESICRFCNLYLVSNCIQMIGELLTAT